MPSDVPDGYERITFKVDAPEFTLVETRAVDPDGGGVNNMVLFCFDVYGIFITTVEAELEYKPGSNNLEGKLTAVIPESTASIHFLGNQNHETILKMDFTNKSEGETMEALEASSGRMIYWAYYKFDVSETAATLSQQLSGKTLSLIRNHALITVNKTPATGVKFIFDGMAVYNSYAFGTACPWHPADRFTLPDWPNASDGKDFVTIPTNKAKLSDIDRTTSDNSRYVYEHENSLEDPISVIISGRKTENDPLKWYRVMLLDNETEEPLMIRRNHHYTINIIGEMGYGHDSFEAAAKGAATNNIWVSVEDDIKEIRNTNFSLSVEETSYILDYKRTHGAPDNIVSFTYTLTNLKGDKLTANDKPEVSWMDGSEVGHNSISMTYPSFENGQTYNSNTYTGTITITLNQMGNAQSLEGILLLEKGSLFRKVKIVTVKTQSFSPSWVSAELYTGEKEEDMVEREDLAHATIMFTIPETTPKELFPFNVLISCNKLDVRFIPGTKDEEGNVIFDNYTLPIVRKDEGEAVYGNSYYVDANGNRIKDEDGNDIEMYGYKYVLEVTDPGVQRVYMTNVLYEGPDAEGNMPEADIYIEAPHFEMMHKAMTFSPTSQTILPVTHSLYGISSSGQPLDENVYYVLVPRKKHAEVEFGVKLASSSSSSSSSVSVGANDEFLIYSHFLEIFNGSHSYNDYNPDGYGCKTYQVPDFVYENSSNGRMMAFTPLARPSTAPEQNGTAGGYRLKFRTMAANSEEVVRISSVPDPTKAHEGYSTFAGKAVFTDTNLGLFDAYYNNGTVPTNYNGFDNYTGKNYRSAVFELSNYNPFRFAAQVTFAPNEPLKQPNNGVVSGLQETFGDVIANHEDDENVTLMEWPYRPDTQVDIALDVTTFVGTDFKHVDPFGEQFDIYIDAPMLEIDGILASAGGRYPDAWKGAVAVDENGDGVADGTVDKFRAEVDEDGNKTGRFIYTVAKTQAEEARFGSLPALRKETMPAGTAPGGFALRTDADTQGERKVLPFKVSSIVSAGEIKISSDKDMVEFYDKTFKISNVSRNLRLTYGPDETEIPANGFVSLELTRNHNRIGVITMKAEEDIPEEGANCLLRLRSEYDYNWYNDEILFRYQVSSTKIDAEGNQIIETKVYTKTFDSLDDLFDNPVANLVENVVTTPGA